MFFLLFRRTKSNYPHSFYPLGVFQRFLCFHFHWVSFCNVRASPASSLFIEWYFQSSRLLTVFVYRLVTVRSYAGANGPHVRDWGGNLCLHCSDMGISVRPQSSTQNRHLNWVNFHNFRFPPYWSCAVPATRHVRNVQNPCPWFLK